MVESIRETAQTPEVELVFYFDDDDPSYQNMKILPQATPTTVFSMVAFTGRRIVMSDMWNVLTTKAHGDILMLSGDDCIFRTKGWDVQVENAFAKSIDKILLCFGDDRGPAGRVFATHPFVHRRWVETIGYFAGPGFSCDYADTWPQDIAEMINRKRYLDFAVEHLHPVWGKAEYDLTYRQSADRKHRDNTPLRYEQTFEDRKRDADKLREILNTPWIPTAPVPVVDEIETIT
jgi:hypothetical protein